MSGFFSLPTNSQGTTRTVLPKAFEYRVISSMLQDFPFMYDMTEEEFVKHGMRRSSGGMNPNRLKEIYKELMEEAGLPLRYWADRVKLYEEA